MCRAVYYELRSSRHPRIPVETLLSPTCLALNLAHIGQCHCQLITSLQLPLWTPTHKPGGNVLITVTNWISCFVEGFTWWQCTDEHTMLCMSTSNSHWHPWLLPHSPYTKWSSKSISYLPYHQACCISIPPWLTYTPTSCWSCFHSQCTPPFVHMWEQPTDLTILSCDLRQGPKLAEKEKSG